MLESAPDSGQHNLQIVLLGQPRGKERPRGTRDGHFYTPAKTRSYEAALKYAAIEVMGDRAPLDGPLSVDIVVKVPIPQSWPKKRRQAAIDGEIWPTGRPDLDNIMKHVDACNLVVWVDDAQIVDARMRKIYSEKPGLWIRVWPL